MSTPSFHDRNALPRNLRARGVTAVLGPTNTGKTHYAIERLLAHQTGMIALPLRLLAREVYGRIVEKVGEDKVALITGEEKIRPMNPRYWVATVEAMPLDVDVAFLAIDEVQLAADLERGHVFTDRILNRRGAHETLLLGAQTMRPILEQLIPGLHVTTRPRLSELVYTGARKMTRLPPRSAIVAFSAEDVYAIAELIRRQRGGAAVVLGALSPRTRNAQVELYQSGEVDFLIATDAIGMGLNLDVDHVAFAGSRKYDGFQFRHLNLAEMGQIAGRAGRHTKDGTFGVTGRVGDLDPETVEKLEAHVFPPVQVLQWRNPDLDLKSLERLSASLAQVPQETGLTRAPGGDDIRVLETAGRDPDIRRMAEQPGGTSRLWDAARLPDYRKIAPAHHSDMVLTLYRFIMREKTIPEDWIAAQVAVCDRTDGDIDTLSARIAHIRTWTYVANRPDWLENPVAWQESTRALEDKLSDALHERLTQRFVDRRTSMLTRRLREKTLPDAVIDAEGGVSVEGQHLGRIEGFRFTPDSSSDPNEARALKSAAEKALASEIERRAGALAESPPDHLAVAPDLTVTWHGAAVGRLVAGDQPLKPRVSLIADEQLTGPARERVQERLERYVAMTLTNTLKPLFDMQDDAEMPGPVRGIAFRLVESLGILERAPIADEIKALDQDARATLRKHGVRFGAFHIFVPALLKPQPRQLAAQLWALDAGAAAGVSPQEIETRLVPELVASGRTSLIREAAIPDEIYSLLGFKPVGKRVVRIDILERLGDAIREAMAWRPLSSAPQPEGHVDGSSFRVAPNMTSLLGCSHEDMAEVLTSLGFRKDRRPAPQPATAPEAGAETPAATEAPAGEAGEVAATGEAAPDAAPAEPTAEAATATTEASDATAGGTAASETSAEATVEASEADDAGDGMIEVWRPGGRRSAERGRPPRRDRPQQGRQGKDGDQQRPPRSGKGGKGNQNRGKGPRNAGAAPGGGKPRQERKADPDSPFAKLASLRKDLEGKS
ncbi:helicase-related protein [Tepidamorphus sp. 3E244]|uniref:helicase-related protein n=1 Tax=Tepidamorphus sp. 3E244 TaxID=3385498 RepID=UPI0038FBF339